MFFGILLVFLAGCAAGMAISFVIDGEGWPKHLTVLTIAVSAANLALGVLMIV
jgi:hypothetical protein